MTVHARPDRRLVRAAHRSERFVLVEVVAPAAPRTERQPVNLAFVLTFIVMFYDVYGWRDQRLLAPHLLLSLLILIASRERSALLLVVGIVATNILIGPAFFKYYRLYWTWSYQSDRSGLASLHSITQRLFIYRENQNAWCNTILWKSNIDPWPYQVIAIPAGIGLSFSFDSDRLAMPLKSQYLLLDQTNLVRLKNWLHVKPLGTTPFGTVYRNLDSHCGSEIETQSEISRIPQDSGGQMKSVRANPY